MSARTSRSVLKLMAGYCALVVVDLSRRTVAQQAFRHEPGEDVDLQTPGAHRRVVLHQLPRLGRGRAEDVDPPQADVRLSGHRPGDDGMARVAHPGVEGDVLLLEGVELLLGHTRRACRTAEKDDGVGVQLHLTARLAPCRKR